MKKFTAIFHTQLTSCVLAALVALPLGSSAMADDIKPGDFNVYSLSYIGTSHDSYGSDIQGLVGAAGDVRFQNFTLVSMQSIGGNSLYAGGTAYLNGGDFVGGVNAGGDIYLQSFSAGANLVSGGNVIANGGQIAGSVAAAGMTSFTGASAAGSVIENAAYSSPMDYAAMNRYFLDASDNISRMGDTGTITNNWGGLSYRATSGINVLSIDADSLRKAWGFQISGPDDAIVYINVSGSDVTMDWLDWNFSGGIAADDLLLNYYDADYLTLQSGGKTNILAPNAKMTYTSGVWTGSIVAGSLEGNGQVNLGHFSHYDENIPEPATLALLLVGGAWILHRRRRTAVSQPIDN